MEFLLYCFFSIVFIFCSYFVTYKNRWTDLLVVTFMSSVFSIFTVILPFSNSDRLNYSIMFENGTNGYIKTLDQIFTHTNFEVAYSLFILIVRSIYDVPEMFFFAVSFVSIFCILLSVYILRYRFRQCTFLLVCSWYIFLTLYSCRQMLAVGISCFAISLFIKHKYKFSLLLTLLASMIHWTAIIVLFNLLISRFVNTTLRHFIFFCFLFISALWGFTFLQYILNYIPNLPFEIYRYFGALFARSNFIVIKGLPYVLLSGISIWRYTKLKQREINIDVILISMYIGVWSYFAAIDMYWIYRIGFYSIFPSILLIEKLYDRDFSIKHIEPVVAFICIVNTFIFVREMLLFYEEIL